MMYEMQQVTIDERRSSHSIGSNHTNTSKNNSYGRTIKDSRRSRLLSLSSSSSSTTKISNMNSKIVDEEERLEIIDLSGLSLETLPTPSINLALICKLDLSNNNLEIIPESLTARLLNVVVLDVHSNQLTSLPNSIGCLSKLKFLNVSGNLLNSLPRTVENCRLLEELNANFNKLTLLPDTIGFELISLKKLSVNSNKLVILPYSLSHATALRVLDVRLNCLRSLPDDLENLVNLEVLNVSQNFHYLVELPYSIGLLMALVELDVSYNKLSELPTSLGCLRKLQKLSVEGNPLVSPPLEVIEQGLHAVRQYMSERINGNNNHDSPKKTKKSSSSSWFKSLKKYGGVYGNGNATPARRSHYEMERGLVLPEYRPIDTLASPRYNLIGLLSPKRFFASPRNYFSKLR